MKYFKNEELKTLEQCSDEEKLCIVNNLKNEVTEIFYDKEWIKAPRKVHLEGIYRVLPKPTKVFCDRWPEWANYLTIDETGADFWQVKPKLKGDNYCPSEHGESAYIPPVLRQSFYELGDEGLPILIERPEE